jgi:2-amino-4-hydroxy-6-hydroxymethyldihydropteridine diphosphokinase
MALDQHSNKAVVPAVHSCLIAMGSNLGDREFHLRGAISQLQQATEIANLQVSSLYETTPVGGPANQQGFLNAAARCTTTLTASDLLQQLHTIEAKLGRTREEHWAARTLDLDLLLYGKQIIETEELTVPHLRMSFRRFVLVPSSEIAGQMVHPTTGHSLAELLGRLDSRPVDIGVYAADPEVAAGVVDSANVALAGQRNCVRVVEEAPLADETPTLLVCLCPASPPSLARRACILAQQQGIPTLALPDNDPQRAVAEIVAAVAAINDHPRKLPASDTWPPLLDTR